MCLLFVALFVYENGTKEKEERTDDASVAGEHQDLERKQVSR